MRPAIRWRYNPEDKTIMPPLIDVTKHAEGMLPSTQSKWKNFTPEMYGLFWSLSVEDIFVPKETYNKHIRILKKAVEDMDDSSTKITVLIHVILRVCLIILQNLCLCMFSDMI